MTDYNTLSDFEINKRVAHLTGWDTNYWHNLPDYCNNPADAWPVIFENKINIMHGWVGNGWGAADSVSIAGEAIEVRHANPLRASMIVFLMMKEGEGE